MGSGLGQFELRVVLNEAAEVFSRLDAIEASALRIEEQLKRLMILQQIGVVMTQPDPTQPDPTQPDPNQPNPVDDGEQEPAQPTPAQ